MDCPHQIKLVLPREPDPPLGIRRSEGLGSRLAKADYTSELCLETSKVGASKVGATPKKNFASIELPCPSISSLVHHSSLQIDQ